MGMRHCVGAAAAACVKTEKAGMYPMAGQSDPSGGLAEAGRGLGVPGARSGAGSGLSGGLRYALPLKEASGEPAGRGLSQLAFDMGCGCCRALS